MLGASWERFENAGFLPAAYKSMFDDTSMTWCGKVLSGELLHYDRERPRGLRNMRRPRTVAKLMRFLQPVNRMWKPLLRQGEVV